MAVGSGKPSKRLTNRVQSLLRTNRSATPVRAREGISRYETGSRAKSPTACVNDFARRDQYSAKMRRISFRSRVLVNASMSRIRHFCGFRLSPGTIPSAS